MGIATIIMAQSGAGMQSSYGAAGPMMGQIQGMNNYNQQFGGRNVMGSGQRPSQPKIPMQPRGASQPSWGGRLVGMAQNFLRRL